MTEDEYKKEIFELKKELIEIKGKLDNLGSNLSVDGITHQVVDKSFDFFKKWISILGVFTTILVSLLAYHFNSEINNIPNMVKSELNDEVNTSIENAVKTITEKDVPIKVNEIATARISQEVAKVAKEEVPILIKAATDRVEADAMKITKAEVSNIRKRLNDFANESRNDMKDLQLNSINDFNKELAGVRVEFSNDLAALVVNPSKAKDAINEKRGNSGFAYYGIFNNGIWSERNFNNNPVNKKPEINDIVYANKPINIREAIIKYVPGRGYQNEPITGLLKEKDKVRVIGVKNVAQNYIWIEFRRVE